MAARPTRVLRSRFNRRLGTIGAVRRVRPETVAVLTERLDRPRWRGLLHAWSAAITAVIAVPFVGGAADGAARVGAFVFVASVFVLLATSGAYHRIDWSLEWALRMKRADHVAILVLLAGTYTPVALVVLDGWLRTTVLLGSWASVVFGMLAAAAGLFERRGVALVSYIVLGWAAVLMAPTLWSRLSTGEFTLVVVGGLLYTIGAVGLAVRWPDPDPAVFGYHEVWHVFTVLAVIAHGSAIWSVTH